MLESSTMAKKMIGMHIPVALHAKLKFRAMQEGRSMTSIVVRLIEDYLDLDYEPSVQDQLADEYKRILAG